MKRVPMKSRISFFSLFNPTFEGGMMARNRELIDLIDLEKFAGGLSACSCRWAQLNGKHGLMTDTLIHQDVTCYYAQ